jgi:hypothetical protein
MRSRARSLLGIRRRPIHQDVHVAVHQARRRDQDEHRDEQSRGGVGARVPRMHEDKTDEHCERAGEIAGEVERVGRERRTPISLRCAPEHDCAAEIDRDHDRDDQERVPGRVDLRLTSAKEMSQRAPGDEETRRNEDRSLGQGGEMLRLAVPVLVRYVRGTDCDPDREKRQQGCDQIRARVQRL